MSDLPRRQRRTHFLPDIRGGGATSCGMIVRSSSAFPRTTERENVNCENCLKHMSRA